MSIENNQKDPLQAATDLSILQNQPTGASWVKQEIPAK